MPTTCREKLRTCSACQTIYEIAYTTNPPMKARKNSFASVWRNSKAADPALQAPSRRILKQNLRHTAAHLILVESTEGQPNGDYSAHTRTGSRADCPPS